MSVIQERRVAMLNPQMHALTDSDVKRLAPSVFATGPRSDVSSRYGFVPTSEVLKIMRANGFVPTHVREYMRRSDENRPFTKHMIRFRGVGGKSDDVKKLIVGDVVPQLLCVNSHDRSSLFQFFLGLFRVLCSNGLMVSETPNITPIIVRHTTSATDGVLDAVGQLVKQQAPVFEHVDHMRSVMLTEKQARQFAVEALEMRPARAGVIDPTQLLIPRRTEDKAMDLWHVYNVVQENLMRGGQNGITANNRAIITRGVDSINADLHINTRLWKLAMETIAKASASSAATVRKARAKPAQAPAGGAQA